MKAIYLVISLYIYEKPLTNKAIGLMLVLKDHKVKLVILISKATFKLTAVFKGCSLNTHITILTMLTYLGVVFRLASIGSSDLKAYYAHIEKLSRVLSIGTSTGKRYYIANSCFINISHRLGIKSIHIKLLNLTNPYIASLNKIIASYYLNIYRLCIDVELEIEPSSPQPYTYNRLCAIY